MTDVEKLETQLESQAVVMRETEIPKSAPAR